MSALSAVQRPHRSLVLAMVGSAALASVNDEEQRVVADLGELKGSRIRFAQVESPPVGGQPSLF